MLNLRVQSRRVTRSVILPIPSLPIKSSKLHSRSSVGSLPRTDQRVGGRGHGKESEQRRRRRERGGGGGRNWEPPCVQTCYGGWNRTKTCATNHAVLHTVWKVPSLFISVFRYHRSCAAPRPALALSSACANIGERGAPTSREHGPTSRLPAHTGGPHREPSCSCHLFR